MYYQIQYGSAHYPMKRLCVVHQESMRSIEKGVMYRRVCIGGYVQGRECVQGDMNIPPIAALLAASSINTSTPTDNTARIAWGNVSLGGTYCWWVVWCGVVWCCGVL